MGLFDSIRRVVGGGESTTAESTAEESPELLDTREFGVATLREHAENVAGEVEQLDFSLESLAQFDAAIDAGYDDELHTPDTPEVYDRDVVRFGAYLGEVIVRVYGGEWTREDGWGVTMAGPDDTVTVSVFEVVRRSIRSESVFAPVVGRAAETVGFDADDATVPANEAGDDSADAVTTDSSDEADALAGESDAAVAEDSGTPGETTTDGPADTTLYDADDGGSRSDEAGAVSGFEFGSNDGTESTVTGPEEDTDDTASPPPSEQGSTTDSDAFDADDATETPADAEPSALGDDAPAETDDDGAGVSPVETPDDDEGPTSTDTTEASSDTDFSNPFEVATTTAGDDQPSAETGEQSMADDGTDSNDDTATSGVDPGDTDGTALDPEGADDADSDQDGSDSFEPEDVDDGGTPLVEEAEPDRESPADDTPAASDTDVGSLFGDDDSTPDTPESDEGTPADEPTETDQIRDAESTEDAEPTADTESADGPDDTDEIEATADPADTDESDDADPADESDDTDPADPTGEPVPDPTDGDGLRAEYAEEAAGFVSFWSEHDLDYTPESLPRLDDLVADEWDAERFADATFGSEATFDDRAFTSVSTELGSYFGEVLVRELGGEWSDETGEDSVVVDGPDGPLAVPVFRVAGTSLKQQPVFAHSYESLLSDLGR